LLASQQIRSTDAVQRGAKKQGPRRRRRIVTRNPLTIMHGRVAEIEERSRFVPRRLNLQKTPSYESTTQPVAIVYGPDDGLDR
jgi:hypothetical protein